MSEEERLSDIYSTPKDRITLEEKKAKPVSLEEDDDDALILEMQNNPKTKKKVSKNGSKEVEYTQEELDYREKKKKFILFWIFAVIDAAFLGYIIYLVVTIFMNLG